MADEVVDPVYSVDMIKLQARTLKSRFKKFMDKYQFDPSVEYWKKTDVKSYKHNWTFEGVNDEGDKYSFYVAAGHNSKITQNKRSKKIDVALEYNPNKCTGEQIERILTLFSWNDPVVKSIDIAVDFYKINIKWMTIIKGCKRKMNTLDYGSDDKTYYLGSEGDDLRVKIYNKAKEMKRKHKGDKVLYEDWTRYEITLHPDVPASDINKFEINKEIPNITYIFDDDLNSDNLNSTDKFILKALKEGVGSLNDLSYRRKKKLEPFLEKDSKKLIRYSLVESKVKDYITRLSETYAFLSEQEIETIYY